MRLVIFFLLVKCLFADVESDYNSNLNKVLTENDLDAVKKLKFTEQDIDFIDYSKELVSSKIQAIENRDEMNSFNLSKYEGDILESLDGLMEESLTSNDISMGKYEDMIEQAFADGVKQSTLNEIEGLKFANLDEKAEVLNELNNITTMDGLSDFLNTTSFDINFGSDIGGTGLNNIIKYKPKNITNDIAGLNQAMDLTLNAFTCVCSANLTSAFNDIKSHIISNNLNPLYANLSSFNETIKGNIKIVEAQTPLIEKSNKLYVEKIAEAMEFLNSLNKQIEIESLKD